MNPLGKWLTWRAAAWSARASARPRGARRARSRAGGWAWPARSGKPPPLIPTDSPSSTPTLARAWRMPRWSPAPIARLQGPAQGRSRRPGPHRDRRPQQPRPTSRHPRRERDRCGDHPAAPGHLHQSVRYLSAASTLTMVIYDEGFAEVARGMDVRTLSLRELVESAAQEGRRALDKPPSTPGRVTMLTAGGGPVPRGVRRDTDGMIENLVAFLDAVDLHIGMRSPSCGCRGRCSSSTRCRATTWAGSSATVCGKWRRWAVDGGDLGLPLGDVSAEG
jgi:hypothetical protein